MNKSKHLLLENELKRIKIFDSSYSRGKSHFEEDGMQSYLVFQPMYGYFKRIAGVGTSNYIYYWQSKGLPNERINSIKTSNYGVISFLSYYGTKTRVEFNGSSWKQDKITYTHGKIVNLYIAYESVPGYSGDNNYPTLQNALFGAVKLTKNAGIDKYGDTGYGIGFDRRSRFLHPNDGYGQNAIILGVNTSSSTKIDNRKKDILIPGKGLHQN